MLTVLQLAILAGLTQPGQNPPLLTRPSAGAGATPGVAMGARVVLIPAHPGTADGSAVVPWPAHCSRFARDAGGGCAPAVVIAGSKKCGTNTVNEVLNVHPYATFKGQSKAGKRLIHGAGGRPFGENWFLECEIYGRGSWPAAVYGCTADGDGWANTSAYATMFDSADWKTTFGLDRSPLANVGRHAGARLMGIAPEARVILVVCEPVRRAWSGINHMVKGYAIRHNLMPSSPNEEPTAANRAEMLGVWQGLVDGILRVLERLVLPSGSAFDTLLLCAEDWPKAGWRKQKSAGPYSDASICREILLPGFYFDGLEGFVRAGFKPHQLIVIDGNWMFSHQKEGGELLYGALGLPGKMENLRMNQSHANIGHDVNPYYHDFGESPVEMQRMLSTLYTSTRSSLVGMFGSAVLDSPASGQSVSARSML